MQLFQDLFNVVSRVSDLSSFIGAFPITIKRDTKGRIEKMSQEKNGVNTDLECDLVLCRNMDSEKGGHHKIGSL